MIWLVWRRQRVPLLVALGLVVLVAAVAVAGRFGFLAAAESQGLLPCLRNDRTDACDTQFWYSYRQALNGFHIYFSLVLIALPGVVGAVAGAGLFGTETARGTHVFALSQSVSRLRWFGLGLIVTVAPVALAIAALTPIVAWWSEPFDNIVGGSILRLDTFLVSGVVPAAYAVLAFCVAAAAGLLLRSTVGALGLALALQVTVLLLTSLVLRPAYLPPERTAMPIIGTDGGFVTGGGGGLLDEEIGLYVGGGLLDAQGRVVDFDLTAPACPDDYYDCMARLGAVATYNDYQPASRYWPFQTIESGILLALAGAALGAGLWGLRRRVH